MFVYVPLLVTLITHFDYSFSPKKEGSCIEYRMITEYGCDCHPC